MFLAQAAVLSVHLRDHMELAPDQVRRMLADFGPPQSRQSSEITADSSFFFGVLGLISNKALSDQGIERFLDIIVVERFAPKAFLKRIFTIDTPTVDAISETLLGHHCSPYPLGFLEAAGVSKCHLTGDRPWSMFCSAFRAKTLDSETWKKLLFEFWEPSMKPDDWLSLWWPSLDAEEDLIAQDGDLMDRLVEIGAICVDQALSHAVRWNQGSRVSHLLGRGADTNRCKISTAEGQPDLDIGVLDYSYLKGFFGVHQLLVAFGQNASTAADHPTINKLFITANEEVRTISASLESNSIWAPAFELALHLAVLYHQTHLDNAIDVLLACRVSPNTNHDLPGNPPKSTLAHAIPKIDLVGRLLRAGARINHPSVITTASSTSKHFECLGFLIAQGMDLAEVGSIGLSVARDNGNEKAFKLLLYAGTDVNRKPDPTPKLWIPPLSMAARKGNVEAARTLLYRGANVDIEDEKRWRPIHYAARFADLRMVKLLVQFGADLSDPEGGDADRGYASVIELCALRTTTYNHSYRRHRVGDLNDKPWSNEDTEIFKYLVDQGAGLNSAYIGDSESLRRSPLLTNLILSSADNSVIRFALRMGTRFDGKFDPEETSRATITPLQAAARKANLEMVKVLHARGADVNAKLSLDLGTTALEAACDGKYDEGNRLAVVEYLLNHGADVNPNTPYWSGKPVSAAATAGYVETTVRLLKCGADVKADILAAWTPLCFAARNGRLDVVQVLLNKDAGVQCPEHLHYEEEIKAAERNGHWAVADLLRKHERQSGAESE